MPAESFRVVTLARILRPRGTRGEVAAEILTDFPERLTNLREVYLWDGHGEPRRAAVRTCWLSRSRGGQAIFHFDGIDSIRDAQRLRGLEVQIPLTERAALPAGRYYITDLIGCDVWESVSLQAASLQALGTAPVRLGSVRDVQMTGSAERQGVPGTPLLVVETPRGELLIPLAEEICTRIDVAARRIEVLLPEGLRDLNRE